MSKKTAAILCVKSVSALSQVVSSPPLILPPKQLLVSSKWPAVHLGSFAAENSEFQPENSDFHGAGQHDLPRFHGGGQYDPPVQVNSDGFHDGRQFDRRVEAKTDRLQTSSNGYEREVAQGGFYRESGQQGFQSWSNGGTPRGGLNPIGFDPCLQSPNGYVRETAPHSRGGQNCTNGGVISSQRNWNSSGHEFQNNLDGVYKQNSDGVAPEGGSNPTGFYGPPKSSSSTQSPNFSTGNTPIGHGGTFHMGGSQHIPAQFSSSGANFQQNSYRAQSPNVGYGGSVVGWRGDNLNGILNMNGSAKPEGQDAGPEEANKILGTVEELDEFCKQGKVKEAVEVLDILGKHGTPVDLPRYFRLMNVCGDTKSLNEAKAVHNHLMRSLGNFEARVYNKIIDMYATCGSMDDAIQVFDKMPQRNLTTWDTLITGYANNGLGEEAIDVFTRFKQLGLNPDGQLFFGLFAACSILNAVDEGMLHFESMVKNYRIAPTMAHYVALIELLGKSGYLDEAMEFIEKMPVEPTVGVWEALMNLSRVYGNVELGERCAKMVECLDTSVLTEQSKAGLVPVKASDVVAKEKEKKLSAPLARSQTYEYRAGDTSHPETDRIHENLKYLSAQMREAGYVPDTTAVLHDIDPESKEEAVLYHSEKLALSHALITTSVRSSVRIIKNLRTCKDCHNAMKVASKLTGREIINRDAKRFHHFRDGTCSCNDFW